MALCRNEMTSSMWHVSPPEALHCRAPCGRAPGVPQLGEKQELGPTGPGGSKSGKVEGLGRDPSVDVRGGVRLMLQPRPLT